LTASGAKPAAITTISDGPFSLTESGALRPASSAEYLISEIKQHKRGVAMVLSAIVIAAAAVAYFALGSSNKDKPIDSVAVLPFLNANGDQNIVFLGANVTERTINSLSRLPG